MSELNTEAVRQGVYDLFATIMDASGNMYPITREEILDAIREGVKEAFMAVIADDRYPISKEDMFTFIKDGVREAFGCGKPSCPATEPQRPHSHSRNGGAIYHD